MDWSSLNNIARELVAWMADTSLSAGVIALLAFLLVMLFRRRATAQHTAWTLVLAGMLVLPFLHTVVPVAHVHLPQVLTSRATPIAPVRLSPNASNKPAPISSSRPS